MRRGKSDKPPLTNRGVISSVRTERQGVVERISTSVDWLTATTQKASGGEGWKAHFLLSQEEPIQDTKFFGFDCRRDAAGQTFGQRARDGRFIYILSGMAANRFWRQIAPRASSVTRFDVAVDCYLREPREQVKHSARVVLSSAYETNRKYARFHGTRGDRVYHTADPSTRTQIDCLQRVRHSIDSHFLGLLLGRYRGSHQFCQRQHPARRHSHKAAATPCRYPNF